MGDSSIEWTNKTRNPTRGCRRISPGCEHCYAETMAARFSRCGAVKSLRDEWIARKCRPEGLRAAPRVLVTYADPAAGHDGATYLAAGARFIEKGRNGKLLFCWPLDDEMRQQLDRWLRARAEVEQTSGSGR